MNVFMVSVPNEYERKWNMRIRNGFERPGLKMGMGFRGLV